MNSFQYIQQTYRVPAEYGRRVTVQGRPGIIVECLGYYIGVNFDDDKPSHVSPCHPTHDVVYGAMGKPRKVSRSSARYQRYLKVSDCFESFAQFLAYEADELKAEKRGFSDVYSYRRWRASL